MSSREEAATITELPDFAAVILDLDGTLFDTERLHRIAFEGTLAMFGRSVDDFTYRALIGLSTMDRTARLASHFGPGFPEDEFIREYYPRKQREIAGGVTMKSGAQHLLNWLREAGIPTALATTASSSTAHARLAAAGIAHLFDAVLTRDDVQRPKPYPDVFLAAAARLGVQPDACIAVEDSGPGLVAAHSAGITTLLVPDIALVPGSVAARAIATVPDLHGVLRLFQSAAAKSTTLAAAMILP